MPLLLGGVAGAVLLAAGVGVAIGAGNSGPSPTPPFVPTPAPTTTVVATATPGPIVSLEPVPTTGPATPNPTPAAPTPGPAGTKLVSADTVEITVPEDWEVDKVETSLISLITTGGGQLYLESTILDTTVTPQQILQAQLENRQASFPDVRICREEGDADLPNGPAGRSVILCYTTTTQSGNSFPVTVYLQAGVTDGGAVVYFLKVYARDDRWDAVVEEVVPVFDSIVWKLLPAG